MSAEYYYTLIIGTLEMTNQLTLLPLIPEKSVQRATENVPVYSLLPGS